MKKLFSILFLLIILQNTYAQKQNSFRGGANIDIALPAGGFGAGANLDLRYNILDNLNAGLKIGSMFSTRNISADKTELTGSVTVSILNSYLIHSDYYFNYDNSIWAPYIGAGFGIYNISNVKVEVNEKPDYSNLLNFSKDMKPGALIRAGVEIGWFRVGAEYNFIPRSDLYDITKKPVATTSNSYFGITAGFYFSNARWGKVIF